MTKRITKINIDGEEYSVGDGGGEELEKLKKYVRPTPDTEEGTSAQFGIFNDNHQTYIQIDSNKTQSNNEYIDNITINNNGIVNNSSAKPNININAKSMNVDAWYFLLNTAYGKICLDSDNKIIRVGSAAKQENENINVLTFGHITNYFLKNNNILFIGESDSVQNINNSIIVTDSSNSYNGLKNSVIVGKDIEVTGKSGVMIGKGLKASPSSTAGDQIIFGQYNKVEDYNVFQIGDGQDNGTRHNLFRINSLGQACLSINKTGNQGVNGPGYVVRAPDENENSSISSSCWPFRITTSSGSTPVRLTYEKKGTTITSSFVVSAKNSDSTNNYIKLTSDENGTKTVTLSDPDAWRSALVTDPDAWRSALVTDPDAWRSALVTDPDAWRNALGITDSTPSYFRRTGSVNTVSWKGLTLNSFPAEGIWVIIFRTYASRANLGTNSTTYLLQQIKINDEIIYEGGSTSSNKHNAYQSDNFYETAIVTHECTTSTKLECLMAKTAGTTQQIFYDITGFKIS